MKERLTYMIGLGNLQCLYLKWLSALLLDYNLPRIYGTGEESTHYYVNPIIQSHELS